MDNYLEVEEVEYTTEYCYGICGMTLVVVGKSIEVYTYIEM